MKRPRGAGALWAQERLSEGFPRQIERPAAGSDLTIASEEGRGVKCADPVEAGLAQCAPHFCFSPPDLFDSLTPSPPTPAVP